MPTKPAPRRPIDQVRVHLSVRLQVLASGRWTVERVTMCPESRRMVPLLLLGGGPELRVGLRDLDLLQHGLVAMRNEEADQLALW